jgi:BTB/POZ domain
MTSPEEIIMIERANLINDPDAFPDVTFAVGSKEIEVTAHKVNLISASEVFKAMFSKNFTTNGKIRVADMEAEAFTQVYYSSDRFSDFLVLEHITNYYRSYATVTH